MLLESNVTALDPSCSQNVEFENIRNMKSAIFAYIHLYVL